MTLEDKLVKNLMVIKDDLAFLKNVGGEFDITDYPFLTGLSNKALLENGKINGRVAERVEALGIMVAHYNEEIHFFFPAGHLVVPEELRFGCVNLLSEDYRDHLEMTALGVEL